MPSYPQRADLPWDDLDGRIVIALPRRRSPIERWIAERIVATPENVLLTFEGIAAELWRQADGTHDLDAIANHLEGQAKDAARMRERVDHFTKRLARRGLITLPSHPQPATDTRRGLTPERGFHAHPCRKCAFTTPIRARGRAWYLCPRCKRLNRLPKGPTPP